MRKGNTYARLLSEKKKKQVVRFIQLQIKSNSSSWSSKMPLPSWLVGQLSLPNSGYVIHSVKSTTFCFPFTLLDIKLGPEIQRGRTVTECKLDTYLEVFNCKHWSSS